MAISASEIKDRASFETWLVGREGADEVWLAQRIAFRALPSIFEDAERFLIENKPAFDRLVLQCFRASLLSSAAGAFSSEDIKIVAQSAASYASRSAAAGAGSSYAAYSATQAASHAAIASSSDAVIADTNAVSAANYATTTAPRVSVGAVVWSALQRDARKLEETGIDLTFSLWGTEDLSGQNDIMPDWNYGLLNIADNLPGFLPTGADGNWGLWLAAYRRKVSAPGGWWFSEEVDQKLASMPPDWWERDDPNVVVDDIARIVGWPPSVPEEQPEAQTRLAPSFAGGEAGPIVPDTALVQAELATDEGALARHSEVLRRAHQLIDLFDPSAVGANRVRELIVEAEGYVEALSQDVASANVDLVIPRGDGLRDFVPEEGREDDLDAAPQIVGEFVRPLNRLIAAHNQYVALDPLLAERDVVLLGPDASANLISPDNGRSLIDDAVANEVATLETASVIEEQGRGAPPVPDAQDRKSRRYSETVRNFARRVVSVTWSFAKAAKITAAMVTGTTAAGFALAKWMVANEAYFLQVFAHNPAMLDTVTRLIAYLKTLPLLI